MWNLKKRRRRRRRGFFFSHRVSMAKKQALTIDNQSPYFCHPSDSPSAIITTIKFDGKNYELLKRKVRMPLRPKTSLDLLTDQS